MELIIANNQARTLVGINRSLTSGVVEHIIFDENELFRAPMRVICPRAVAVIASIPESVANLNRLHIYEIELAMINHAQQESIDAYIDRLKSVKHTVVNAERVRISAKLNSCFVSFFCVVGQAFEGESRHPER